MKKVKNVLNISKYNDQGSRFNNLALKDHFKKYGWKAKFQSFIPSSQNSSVTHVAGNKYLYLVTRVLAKLGRLTGHINGYHINSMFFTKHRFHREADLLHFHIMHEEFLTTGDWIRLSKNKPVIWTWHDPFMLTGHCIYPKNCRLYETGCLVCPNLDFHFPVKIDRSKENLKDKVDAIKKINPLVIVSSELMMDLIKKSVYSGFLRVKLLPFGICDKGVKNNKIARMQFNIPQQNIVLAFRGIHSEYKSTDFILYTIKKLAKIFPNLPLTIIIFQERNLLLNVNSDFQIIETGWVEGDTIFDYLSAADFYLMPSNSESFGMMAIEAMICGAIPIVTKGLNNQSALPELVKIRGTENICNHDNDSFYKLVLKNILRKNKSRELVKKIARENFGAKVFTKNLCKIYDEEFKYFNNL
jgi:glycosyltransferase involved in cell wall biosynthesis